MSWSRACRCLVDVKEARYRPPWNKDITHAQETRRRLFHPLSRTGLQQLCELLHSYTYTHAHTHVCVCVLMSDVNHNDLISHIYRPF